MAFDYAGMAATANELFAEFGQAVTITRRTSGAYAVATGIATVTSSTQRGTGAVFDWQNRDIDGTLIRTGDKRLILSAVGITAPAVDDTVTIGGTVYTVKVVKPLAPAGTVVMYELNLRGTA